METSTTIALEDLLRPMRTSVLAALEVVTSARPGCPERLCDAIRYSVFAPGKRVRPVLALLACEAVSGTWQAALPAACAVELVHVYSLIHDDLPCMDNDQLRRGKPTCHVQFDEATAFLAGDSLQMLAIEVLSEQLPTDCAVRCCQVLSRAAGRCQLVGGQMDDLAAEGRFGPLWIGRKQFDQFCGSSNEQGNGSDVMESGPSKRQKLEFLKAIHRRKTGALIEASLQMGGIVGGAEADALERLATYGQSIGLAFQIIDDCLDEESTSEQLGKTPQKDSRQGKMTYPSLIGLEESRRMAERLVDEACAALSVFGETGSKLEMVARFIIDRKN